VVSSQKLYRIVGETIRVERKRAGLSQEELAEKADLNRNYIGEIERAEKKITLETLQRIGKVLRLRITDLLAGL
jgi:transcriptional regulator with XRE-family HTH domain